MSRPQARARGNFAQDTLTAEFTTGQIVIMACAALAAACTMFALGVLVGRYDPSTAAEKAATEDTALADATAVTPAPPVAVAAKAPEVSKPVETIPPQSLK